MDTLIGKTLGGFEVLNEIGRGGMAIVYKAHHRSLDREVALKVLPPQFAFDNEFVKRFLLEARAAAKLKHPNIVTIYDVGEQDGFYYIVMEWIDGDTLADLIRKAGALPPTRAANILAQIASALDYAHALGFVHRDVKPSNILISANDHATLTDFGIVKAAEGTRVTRTGTMVGTPEYMSPEQIRGQAMDGRADIYSLGVVGYEILAGRVPFAGDTARVLHAQVYEAPPSLRTINPRVSPTIEQVVNKAMAKEPAQRYARAGEFANALNAALNGNIPTRQAAAASNISSSRPEINQAWWWIGGAVGASLLLILFVFLLFGDKSGANGNTNGILTTTPAQAAVVVPTLAPSAAFTVTPHNTVTRTTSGKPTFVPTYEPTNTRMPPTISAESGVTERMIGGAPMMFVPSGDFFMGSLESDFNANENEKPQHTVYLNWFWIDKHEVTNEQYARCVDARVCMPPSPSGSFARRTYYGEAQFNDYPVINISWNDATTFCQWAGKRLPTEAEWEKAARGTDGRIYPWGNQYFDDRLNSNQVLGETIQVGYYPLGASPYGVMDMAGNVWEWVGDWYDETYYSRSPSRNPQGPSEGAFRGLRGGSYYDGQNAVRTTFRYVDPAERHDNFGFRCAQ